MVEQILQKFHYNASIMLECSAVTKLLKKNASIICKGLCKKQLHLS